MIDIRGSKIAICGLQGSGKTFYAIQEVIRNNYKVLVFSPHWHDFETLPNNFYFYEGFSTAPAEIEKFFIYAKKLCQQGIIDGVFMDEFDMYFQNVFEIGQTATDVFANHRHYNMFMIMITRRPQDIPAKVFESCKFIIAFSLQGENARNKFNGTYKGLGDSILALDYSKYEYYQKEIGKPPVKMPAI
jgi:hypothetical protein